jgi:hypothetical protein
MIGLWIGVLACLGSKDDTGDSPVDTGPTAEELCAGAGEESLVIGTGVGSQFVPMEPDSTMSLDVAPQGGFGVTIRARTTGIRSTNGDLPHAPVTVELATYIDGVQSASFLNENVEIYCQDDGTGLLWGVVVGFDPEEYSTTDDLFRLDGVTTALNVITFGGDGDTAEGWVDVVISVGR